LLLRFILLPGVELETETAAFLPPTVPAPRGAFASPLATTIEEQLAGDSFPLAPGDPCGPINLELPWLEFPSLKSRASFWFPLPLAKFGCDRLWRGTRVAAGPALAIA